MAEQKIKQSKKESLKQEASAKKRPVEQDQHETLVRVFGYDLPGSKNLYTALTRIKGISWAISNALCLKLGYPRSKKVSELSKDELSKVEAYLHQLDVPDYLKNRCSDPETGKTSHLYGTDLDIARDFDIKRMKKIKSYKGIRHSSKLPVRGQRTRSHFRTRGRATGMTKKTAPKKEAPK